mmetsp:Transcript_41162/g.92999  ORF Transcript_41162/g.92999 Transcript_41162/m.92999 type:complete len:230 (-) Transcript_41162:376-1065(-)
MVNMRVIPMGSAHVVARNLDVILERGPGEYGSEHIILPRLGRDMQSVRVHVRGVQEAYMVRLLQCERTHARHIHHHRDRVILAVRVRVLHAIIQAIRDRLTGLHDPDRPQRSTQPPIVCRISAGMEGVRAVERISHRDHIKIHVELPISDDLTLRESHRITSRTRGRRRSRVQRRQRPQRSPRRISRCCHRRRWYRSCSRHFQRPTIRAVRAIRPSSACSTILTDAVQC